MCDLIRESRKLPGTLPGNCGGFSQQLLWAGPRIPWGVFWGEHGRFLRAFFDGCCGEFFGETRGILGAIMGALHVDCLRETSAKLCRSPGGVSTNFLESPRGDLQSLRGVWTSSWRHSAAALGTALDSYAKSSGILGQLLRAFLGDCLGKSV